jgi:hypothetical protein
MSSFSSCKPLSGVSYQGCCKRTYALMLRRAASSPIKRATLHVWLIWTWGVYQIGEITRFHIRYERQSRNAPFRDGHELHLRSSQIQVNRDPVQPVDQRRMRQSLAVALDLSKGRRERGRGRQTRDSQICLSIFDVVFG